MIRHLRRLFTYDEWANREVLNSLKGGIPAPSRSLKLLAHILSAEQLWLERVQSQPQSLAVWPDFDLKQCEEQHGRLAALWREYLAQLDEAELSRSVSYKNSKGESWNSRVEDILVPRLMTAGTHALTWIIVARSRAICAPQVWTLRLPTTFMPFGRNAWNDRE